MKFSIILFAAFAFSSCGGGTNTTIEKDEKEVSIDNLISPYLGFAHRCIDSAQEVMIESESGNALYRVEQKIKCSPVFKGTSRDEVNDKIDAWQEEHCSKPVPVKPLPNGQYSNCTLEPTTRGKVVSNVEETINSTRESPGYCSGDGVHSLIRCN